MLIWICSFKKKKSTLIYKIIENLKNKLNKKKIDNI